jgi:hypothetical protein
VDLGHRRKRSKSATHGRAAGLSPAHSAAAFCKRKCPRAFSFRPARGDASDLQAADTEGLAAGKEVADADDDGLAADNEGVAAVNEGAAVIMRGSRR